MLWEQKYNLVFAFSGKILLSPHITHEIACFSVKYLVWLSHRDHGVGNRLFKTTQTFSLLSRNMKVYHESMAAKRVISEDLGRSAPKLGFCASELFLFDELDRFCGYT